VESLRCAHHEASAVTPVGEGRGRVGPIVEVLGDEPGDLVFDSRYRLVGCRRVGRF
jgi:hypothetical protein